MATLAGLALLTRVSTGVGLYLAMSLLLLSLAARASNPAALQSETGDASHMKIKMFLRWLFSPRALVPTAILISFVGLCGIVNYGRWGSPFTFADLQIHVSMPPHLQSGVFNILRLWYGLIYYFFPINFIIGPDGKFLFEDLVSNLYDNRELPPSSFLISDAFLILLSAYFLRNWTSKGPAALLDRQHVAALIREFVTPILLVSPFYYAAFRYRGEFYAFLDFTALLGFYVFSRQHHAFPTEVDKKFGRLLFWSAVIGIIASHFLLIAYKLSPFGSAHKFLPSGLVKGYYMAFDRWLNGIW